MSFIRGIKYVALLHFRDVGTRSPFDDTPYELSTPGKPGVKSFIFMVSDVFVHIAHKFFDAGYQARRVEAGVSHRHDGNGITKDL